MNYLFVEELSNGKKKYKLVKGEDILAMETAEKSRGANTIPYIILYTKSSDKPTVLTFTSEEERDTTFFKLIDGDNPTEFKTTWHMGMF